MKMPCFGRSLSSDMHFKDK